MKKFFLLVATLLTVLALVAANFAFDLGPPASTGPPESKTFMAFATVVMVLTAGLCVVFYTRRRVTHRHINASLERSYTFAGGFYNRFSGHRIT
jgi:hypothetical protein